MKYWSNDNEYQKQSELWRVFYERIKAGYERIQAGGNPGRDATESFKTLADDQRKQRIGCTYPAGSRVDSNFGTASQNVGLLHSALCTDLPKAIAPAFHADHDELMVCTDGQVVIEYSVSLAKSATVEQTILNAGDYFLIKRNWPHRIAAAILRSTVNPTLPELKKELVEKMCASFLAVKMGSLTGKSGYETMSNWSQSGFNHPLVERFKEDEAYLGELKKNARLWAQLCMPEEEKNDTPAPQQA
jgi:hypothetical protein